MSSLVCKLAMVMEGRRENELNTLGTHHVYENQLHMTQDAESVLPSQFANVFGNDNELIPAALLQS